MWGVVKPSYLVVFFYDCKNITMYLVGLGTLFPLLVNMIVVLNLNLQVVVIPFSEMVFYVNDSHNGILN